MPLSPEDADALRVVDAELDGCFSGLYSVLQGWTKVPATGAHAEKVTAAREVLMVIYPDGLKFTQLPFKEQWAESQTRLDLIDEHGIEKKLDLLGAKPFVDGIRVAHKNYGDLQGLTKAAAAETAMLELRTALDAFLGSVRAYVVKVAAIVDEDDKASVDLADTLLQPLREWVTRPPRIAADDPTAVDPMAPEAAVAPVMPAAPAAPVASLESTAPGMPGSSPFIDGRD
ncbi:MAG: hypothetical protein HOW73_49530 [Polyangiaceae bacterium]|nr:hypothetical protein [Polyangiaceae bacterium]